MKFKTLGLYTVSISLIASFYNVVVASEINESQIFKLPTNTDSLDSSHNAQLLLSESSKEEEITVEEETTSEEETTQKETEIEYTLTPLQLFPFEPMTVETANTLPPGILFTSFGANVFSVGSEGEGTGLQVFNTSIEYGIAKNFQIGADLSVFDDVLSTKFNGQITDFGLFSLAPNFKYKFIEGYSYSLALVGSLEWIKITSESGLFNKGNTSRQENSLAGTIQIPLTYNLTDNAQWHFVAGVAIFPDTINGGDFYGTFFNIGTGVSFKFAERLGFFADVNVPLGPDGNSASTSGNIGKEVVWSAGFNYLHSPAVGVDLSVTNRFGNTPATKLLTFLPDGGQVAVGLNVRYTPDLGYNYRASFAENPSSFLKPRDKQLVLDGIILTSASSLREGMFSINTGYNDPNDYHFRIGYGMSDNAQLEFGVQQVAPTREIYAPVFDDNLHAVVATKLNFLNQQQGDPVSLGIRGSFQTGGRPGGSGGGGGFSAETAFAYSANDVIAFTFNPKAGFFGDNRIAGTGLGLNIQALPGFQLIGEVTPMVSNDPTVWAAGVRYMHPNTSFGLGVYGTNAVATSDIGSILRQSDNNITVGVNIMFLLGNIK